MEVSLHHGGVLESWTNWSEVVRNLGTFLSTEGPLGKGCHLEVFTGFPKVLQERQDGHWNTAIRSTRMQGRTALLSNTSRYPTERRQTPSRAAGFGSRADEAADRLFCYCQESLVTEQSHLFESSLALLTLFSLHGEVRMKAFQCYQKGCGSERLLECGICSIVTLCPEHSPPSTSAAAQLQKHTGKIHETLFQLIFYLKVCFLILKKQLVERGKWP